MGCWRSVIVPKVIFLSKIVQCPPEPFWQFNVIKSTHLLMVCLLLFIRVSDFFLVMLDEKSSINSQGSSLLRVDHWFLILELFCS